MGLHEKNINEWMKMTYMCDWCGKESLQDGDDLLYYDPSAQWICEDCWEKLVNEK